MPCDDEHAQYALYIVHTNGTTKYTNHMRGVNAWYKCTVYIVTYNTDC